MIEIKLHNIPNYYCAYYVFGFFKNTKLQFSYNREFQDFNYSPYMIMTINGQLIVIDNNDPVGLNKKLYQRSDYYFATNKLINSVEDNSKIIPLFPHYPINVTTIYLKLFGLKLLKPKSFKNTILVLKNLVQRPRFRDSSDFDLKHVQKNYIFFISRIWRKEHEANMLRYKFIKACKLDSRYQFVGGFRGRSDGQNLDFGDAIFNKKISPKLFSKLSSKSCLVLNSPAVKGAISWRLAEYLKNGLFILSTEFKVHLPVILEHDTNILYFEKMKSFENVLNFMIDNEGYVLEIRKGARNYFEKYCTPQSQVNYILSFFKN